MNLNGPTVWWKKREFSEEFIKKRKTRSEYTWERKELISRTRSSFASGVTSICRPWSFTISLVFASIKSTILIKSFLSSALNSTISSSLFKNSGLKYWPKLFLNCSWWLFSAAKPTLASLIPWPALEVIMMMVSLKETVRPCESVKRPSSRICKNRWSTSGWAFSISSNKIKLYGLWRTLSVNWPASS